MQQLIPLEISIPSGQGQILIDRDELLRLRSMGLLSSNKDYIYMALEIDYPKARKNVDTELMAERWSTGRRPLSSAEVLIAIGQLAKQQLLDAPKQLKLDFFDEGDES